MPKQITSADGEQSPKAHPCPAEMAATIEKEFRTLIDVLDRCVGLLSDDAEPEAIMHFVIARAAAERGLAKSAGLKAAMADDSVAEESIRKEENEGPLGSGEGERAFGGTPPQ